MHLIIKRWLIAEVVSLVIIGETKRRNVHTQDNHHGVIF